MRRLSILAVFCVAALPALAQFQEKIEVSAVLVDAIVTDSNGHQILGLTKDDFVVKENGVEQQIDSVDYRTNLRLLNEREENAPFKVERVNEGRYFVFFFDKPEDIGAGFGKLALARRAARDFIRNKVAPGDYVAIVGHDVRLKIYSDFTSDKKQLERALNDVPMNGAGLTNAPAGDGPSIVRNLPMGEVMTESGRVYRALDYLADALKPIRGRKNLILFSNGIRDNEEFISGDLITSRSRFLDPAIESLNAANVSVYGLQMQTDPSLTPIIHQRLEEIALATGGEYYRFNTTFDVSLGRIVEKNTGYYLITYRSSHPRGESGFQKVDVSLKPAGLRVTARRGYQYGA